MWLVPLLVLAPALPPQRALAHELEQRSAAVERGSPEWFRLGFERIEAELRWDVHGAHVDALHLLEEARLGGEAGLLATAAALADLTLATLEGPAHSGAWSPLAAGLPEDAPDWLRARHALARSRQLCLAADLGDELACALEGSARARASDDLGLRALAAFTVFHVTHDSTEALHDDLLAELDELSRRSDLGGYRQRLLFLEYDRSFVEYTRAERTLRLDEVERLAEEQGDRVTLGNVALARADLAFEAGEGEEALRWQEAASAEFERLGDPRNQAHALENACDIAISRREFARAHELLERASALIEGRGFKDRESGLLQSRFSLAVLEKDGDEIAALTDRLDQIEQEEQEELLAYVPLRDQLLSAERRRVEAERDLAAGRAELEASRATMRRVVVAGVLVMLAILAALALRSRAELLRANRRLAEEMARAEREAGARRSLEERMRELERTESLGLVAGGVAHDFNNLMLGVLGNADLLLLKERDPARREILQAIAASGQRARGLCRQLQDYTGEGPGPMAPVDLALMVQELVPVLRTAGGGGLELVVRCAPDLPVIEGDHTALEQALLNLVTNARDARAHTVVLTARVLELTQAELEDGHYRGEVRPGRYACLEVEDDGEGMTEELVARVFDPFFTTRFPGRGLGLAVVLGAVRRHAGLIAVASRPGAGSRFRLCLPLAGEAAHVLVPRAPTRSAPPAETVAPLDVLAIDDEAPVRAFLELALAERGHRVRTLASGAGLAAALAGFQTSERALVLLDLTLPDQDGRDLARAVRALAPALPIVLMSGHSGPHIAELARELGLAVWIQKPFTVLELEAVLARALLAEARAGAPVQAGK